MARLVSPTMKPVREDGFGKLRGMLTEIDDIVAPLGEKWDADE